MTESTEETDAIVSDTHVQREPSKKTSPRVVLAGCVLFVIVGASIYIIAPEILPARLVDGPMVQNVTGDAASLIWYTSKPVPGHVVIQTADRRTTWTVASEGKRNRARLTGLQPATRYTYEIQHGGATIADGSFSTAKTHDQPFSFIVFGDSGRATVEQYTLANVMAGRKPDFLLHTGDVVYGAGERVDYPDRFFSAYEHMLSEICFWPSMGNHDRSKETDGSDYLGVFELPENGPPGLPPEHNYWFDYGNARVAVVDSNMTAEELSGRVAPWLSGIMADASIRWRFVALHHPPYTCGHHNPDEKIQETLVPIFESSGVDIVFAGHNHWYERTAPLRGGSVVPNGAGVVYIISGAGGASLYTAPPPDQRPAYTLVVNDQTHSFTHVRISGDNLTLRQIGLAGDVLDEWGASKPHLPVAGALDP